VASLAKLATRNYLFSVREAQKVVENINPTTSKNLRIALVGPLPPPPGGMANQTQQLAHLLEQEGVHVEIVQANAPYRPHWICLLRGARALFRLIPFLLRLWGAAGRVQLFHVMANSGWAWHLCAAPAVWVAKLRRIPVMVNYRGGDAAEFFTRSFFWIRPTMWMSNQRVVPSRYLEQVFRSFGLSAEIVPNIIDLKRFAPCPSKRSRSRCDSAHLVVARNLEPLYDISTALRAFAIVREKRPDASMTIAGGGPEREKLVALAHELGVAPHVKFTGSLDNSRVAELFMEADVFVNASLHDNMPISFLEALASGVPIVSTNVCGIPFLVEHQRTAILVPPRDAVAMAQAVLHLLDNPKIAEQLVRAGWDLVQQYTWHRVRARLLDVYFELINYPVSKAEVSIR
jgi:glycosyltransferase involved in cell wall biosynthesis